MARRTEKSGRNVHVQAIAVLFFGGALAALTMSACGSRGPLDDEPYVDATVDVVPDVELDTGADVRDANVDARREAGGFLACPTCLFDQCQQQLLNCVQSQACQQVFQCVITTCAGSGGLNPQCLLQCGQGDISGALQALQVFQCITGKCGPDCAAILGLLGGLGGGGSSSGGSSTSSSSSSSSSGGPKDGGNGSDGGKKNAAFKQAFSAWPAMVSSLPDE